jgi:L-alanine-DL-glutamate epimerase-like enolase superfamily enzyme
MRVLSAVDLALWDLLGKSLDTPVYRLIGGRSNLRVPVYNTCVPLRYGRRRASGELPALLRGGRSALGKAELAHQRQEARVGAHGVVEGLGSNVWQVGIACSSGFVARLCNDVESTNL